MEILEKIWTILFILTMGVFAFAWFWLAFEAFRKHYLWGLANLLFPLAWFAFAVVHWDRARRPVLLQLAAFALLFFELLIGSGYQTVRGT